jgi:hypothetical protein
MKFATFSARLDFIFVTIGTQVARMPVLIVEIGRQPFQPRCKTVHGLS